MLFRKQHGGRALVSFVAPTLTMRLDSERVKTVNLTRNTQERKALVWIDGPDENVANGRLNLPVVNEGFSPKRLQLRNFWRLSRH